MSQSNLDLTTEKKTGPVECLGQSFESDEARRAHYTELLREKLKDPEFRKIEGFPIGEDEDILNLSDPPYYTACPNPWIGDFIAHYGKPYDPKVKYHREPYAADVSEGKNHPIYNAHSYHTKVPHRAIMRYILHYTEPGDVVFDGFCGTGMTGVAAQLCGDEKEVRELGHRVDGGGTIYSEDGKPFSNLGARQAVLNDLSPAATFIAYNYNTPVDIDAFEKEAKRILDEVDSECGWMYETKHTDGSVAKIDYTVWSEVFTCTECGGEITFYTEALDKNTGRVRDQFPCPHCGYECTKRTLERVMETVLDPVSNEPWRRVKFNPCMIQYRLGKTKFEKELDENDIKTLKRIEGQPWPLNLPSVSWPIDSMYHGSRIEPKGFFRSHHFFLPRPAQSLSRLWKKAQEVHCERTKSFLLYFVEQAIWGLSRMNRYSPSHFSQVNRTLSGVYYIASQHSECSPWYNLNGKLSRIIKAFSDMRSSPHPSILSTLTADSIPTKDNSIDYVFTDPPFGENIFYADMNILVESFHGVLTHTDREAIIDKFKGKALSEYRELMLSCFKEYYRVLKPGRWITVEFSNSQAAVWNAIQSTLELSGFIVANVAALDKKQGSFRSVTTTTAVKQDLVISAYKPSAQLELDFAKHGDSIEGVWDFLQTHLKNLPIVKPKGGALEFIAERDPRILYDRMVAFYVGHNTPVPLSSGEFQSALSDEYPERDGMVFLHEQVAEYDKKAAQMQHVGQLAIFVEDEKSAINWLRQTLKEKPDTYQGIHPDFMQQLSASWKKFETRPELSVLLDQNFIKYDGTGDVPGQIHGYLSTNYKTLRKLEKDNPTLQAEAKDRWYVPDPKKAVDVEAVRNKRLLAEFWDYAEQAGINKKKPGDPNQGSLGIQEPAKKKAKVKKLKEVRTEAIRLGFMECNRNKDAATILAIAEILPKNVIEEDEQLQMIYDMAEMRAG